MSALSAEQLGRERALSKAALLDVGCVGLLLAVGLGADSLTNLAEGIRGGLMTLIDLVALVVLRRLHAPAVVGARGGRGQIVRSGDSVHNPEPGRSVFEPLGHEAVARVDVDLA